MESIYYEAKVVVVGCAVVGKTQFVKAVSREDTRQSTTEVDLEVVRWETVSRTSVKLTVHDTPSDNTQKRKSILQQADVLLVLFAFDDYQSFSHVRNYLIEASRLVKIGCRFIIVGNKSDVSPRKMSEKEITDLRNMTKRLPYFETTYTSARTHQLVINHICEAIVQMRQFEAAFGYQAVRAPKIQNIQKMSNPKIISKIDYQQYLPLLALLLLIYALQYRVQ